MCMEYIGKKLDMDLVEKNLPNLTDGDLARGRCLRIMLEDHLYWCLATLGMAIERNFGQIILLNY